jgi:hypothetical protein
MRTTTKMRSKLSLLFIALAAMIAIPAIALADTIYNKLDNSIDVGFETLSLTAGGQNGSVPLYVNPTDGDGKEGCNLTGQTTLVASVSSSDTSVATVTDSVTFNSCGAAPELTVTPVAQGTANITLTQTSNSSKGTFDLYTCQLHRQSGSSHLNTTGHKP